MKVFFTIVLIISTSLKFIFFYTVAVLNSLNLFLIKNHSLLCSFQGTAWCFCVWISVFDNVRFISDFYYLHKVMLRKFCADMFLL